MNDIDFRNTLVKALELDRTTPISEKSKVLSTLLKSNTYIEYTSITLNQLYNKLHTYVSSNIAADQSSIIKTALRSASGIISSINDLRNRHSLAHPNGSIINSREAKLCIKLVKDLTDYIEQVV